MKESFEDWYAGKRYDDELYCIYRKYHYDHEKPNGTPWSFKRWMFRVYSGEFEELTQRKAA